MDDVHIFCWFAGAIEKPLVGHEISHHDFFFQAT